MNGEVQFNLQQFLEDMKRELREDIKDVGKKVDVVATGVQANKGRIDRVEDRQRWFFGALIAVFGATLTAIMTDAWHGFLRVIGLH